MFYLSQNLPFTEKRVKILPLPTPSSPDVTSRTSSVWKLTSAQVPLCLPRGPPDWLSLVGVYGEYRWLGYMGSIVGWSLWGVLFVGVYVEYRWFESVISIVGCSIWGVSLVGVYVEYCWLESVGLSLVGVNGEYRWLKYMGACLVGVWGENRWFVYVGSTVGWSLALNGLKFYFLFSYLQLIPIIDPSKRISS